MHRSKVLAFFVVIFLFTCSYSESACSYLNETFSSTLTNQWSTRNATWAVVNGKLNVSNITVDKLAYAETTIHPMDYFTVDVDVSPVSFASSNGAYGLYIFTSGDVFFSVNGKTSDGFAIFIRSNNLATLSFYDVNAGWSEAGKLTLASAPTSIGLEVSPTGITVRINKQSSTLKLNSSIPLPYIIDKLWLMAQGSGNLFVKGTEVNFDNVCADPVQSATQYTLTVTKAGTGSGTVNGSGISCGSDCTEKYTTGTSVTLTATADAGSTFTGWSGACSGTGNCTVSMSSDKSVTATFTRNAVTASCTATLDSNLLVHVPIMKFSNTSLGTVYLWVNLQYVFDPSVIKFRLKDYGIISGTDAAAYNCPQSSLSETLSMHINELMIDGTSFWLDLDLDSKTSTGNDLYFKAVGYNVNQRGSITPVLTAPAYGATNQSVTPTLVWTGSADATAYRVFIATSAGTLNGLSNTATTCSGCVYTANTGTFMSHTIPAGTLSAGTTYYWVVKAAYSNDQKWSSIGSFTTASGGGGVNTVALASPLNGATNQSVTLTLSWNATGSPTAYRIFVAKDENTLKGLSVDSTTCSGCVLTTNTGTTASYTFSSGVLQTGTKYYWMVKAAYSTASMLSEIWTFTTSSEDGFQFGTPKTYTISGVREINIQDSITGNTFRFPQGGQGTLTIKPVILSPVEIPFGGFAYSVMYSGNDAMQVLVPYKAEEEPFLWFWGELIGSVYESPAPNETWLPIISDDITRNPATFALYSSGNIKHSQSVNLKASRTGKPDMIIWQKNIDKTFWVSDSLRIYANLVKNDIQQLVNLFPPNVKERAETEIYGRLNPGVQAYARPGVYTHYNPFGWLGGADPYFVFRASGTDAADVSAVAHEVGHYMSHVLVGDANMKVLAKQANKIHGIGQSHAPKRNMLEEYAYFSDFCINSRVSGMVIVPTLGDSPDTIDYPSKEGFATSLLVMLNKNTTQTRAFTGINEDIPPINASLTDLWGILARGPLSVDDLHAYISEYLGASRDKLNPILERNGWSYNGYGRIVDKNNNGIEGALVQAVAKVSGGGDSNEYLAPPQPVITDKYGKFQLSRIFPGNNFIRVWPKASDTKTFQDFSFGVNPEHSTTTTQFIGDITVGTTGLTFSKTRTWTETSLAGKTNWTLSFSGTVSGPADLTLTEQDASLMFDPSEGEEWSVYRITTNITDAPIKVEGSLKTNASPSSGRDYMGTQTYLDWSYTDPQLWATDEATGRYIPLYSSNFSYYLYPPYGFFRTCYTYNYNRSFFDGKTLKVYPAERVSRGCIYIGFNR